MRLEPLGQPLVVVHGYPFSSASVIAVTDPGEPV
jgi:hypothetical protein